MGLYTTLETIKEEASGVYDTIPRCTDKRIDDLQRTAFIHGYIRGYRNKYAIPKKGINRFFTYLFH